MKNIFGRMKEKLQETKKEIKETPLDYIVSTITLIICLLSIMSCIVLWIVFMFKGGYGEQIALIKSGNFESVFTYGNVKILYNPIGYINIALTVVCALTIVILFLKEESTAKKIIFIVDTIVSVVCTTFVAYISIYESWLQENDREKYEKLYMKLHEFGIEKATKILYGIVIVVLVLLILNCILLITSIVVDDYLKNLIKVDVLSFGVIPLVLLALENIIQAVLVIVVLGVLFVIFGVGLSGGENSSSNYGQDNDYENLMEKVNISPDSCGWKEQKLLQDLEYAQEQYKRCLESAENNRMASSSDYKSALNGGTIFSSAEEKLEDARNHTMHASYDDKDAAYFKEMIINIKRKLK